MYFAHDTLADENERLRQELKRVSVENKTLQHQMTQMKHSVDRDAAYHETLESELETLRRFRTVHQQQHERG